VVALNRDCVPRAALGETSLHDDDEIEILAPMQGG
jgi:thiamine biosynthesis protein ThiS